MATGQQGRAAEGAALLDGKVPGWWERVDAGRLGEETVLQQLYGRFRAGSAIVSLTAPYHRGDTMKGLALAARFGFAASEERYEPSLRAAWRREIERRREGVRGL